MERCRTSSHRLTTGAGVALLTCLVLAAGARPAVARSIQEQPAQEYPLKAAFLYNFAKFVRWPPQAFDSGDREIVVCVIGRDPFGAVLDETLEGQSVDGMSFRVRRIEEAVESGGCQILFVPRAAMAQLPEIVAEVDGAPVLTVGEAPTFAERGGIINFFIENNRIRFEINLERSRRAELEISSRLLSLARIVSTGDGMGLLRWPDVLTTPHISSAPAVEGR